MVYKGVADLRPPPLGGPVTHIAAKSASPLGPFIKHDRPVFTAEGFDLPAEAALIWRQDDRYWAIVKDMNGAFTNAGRSLASFTSDDGFAWNLAEYPLVARTEFRWADGRLQPLHALERPQLLWMVIVARLVVLKKPVNSECIIAGGMLSCSAIKHEQCVAVRIYD